MTALLDPVLQYWSAGGLLLLPLAGVCMGIWAYTLRSRERLKRVAQECRTLEQQVAAHGLNHSGTGWVADLLNRVRADIRGGEGPHAAFHTRGDAGLDLLRRDIVVLSALTAVAPLLGLLGTVRGMIETFAAVARLSGSTGMQVADGIRQALITTQFGLVIAVPGVFAISRLRAMLQEVEAGLGSLRAVALPYLEQERPLSRHEA